MKPAAPLRTQSAALGPSSTSPSKATPTPAPNNPPPAPPKPSASLAAQSPPRSYADAVAGGAPPGNNNLPDAQSASPPRRDDESEELRGAQITKMLLDVLIPKPKEIRIGSGASGILRIEMPSEILDDAQRSDLVATAEKLTSPEFVKSITNVFYVKVNHDAKRILSNNNRIQNLSDTIEKDSFAKTLLPHAIDMWKDDRFDGTEKAKELVDEMERFRREYAKKATIILRKGILAHRMFLEDLTSPERIWTTILRSIDGKLAVIAGHMINPDTFARRPTDDVIRETYGEAAAGHIKDHTVPALRLLSVVALSDFHSIRAHVVANDIIRRRKEQNRREALAAADAQAREHPRESVAAVVDEAIKAREQQQQQKIDALSAKVEALTTQLNSFTGKAAAAASAKKPTAAKKPAAAAAAAANTSTTTTTKKPSAPAAGSAKKPAAQVAEKKPAAATASAKKPAAAATTPAKPAAAPAASSDSDRRAIITNAVEAVINATSRDSNGRPRTPVYTRSKARLTEIAKAAATAAATAIDSAATTSDKEPAPNARGRSGNVRQQLEQQQPPDPNEEEDDPADTSYVQDDGNWETVQRKKRNKGGQRGGNNNHHHANSSNASSRGGRQC